MPCCVYAARMLGCDVRQCRCGVRGGAAAVSAYMGGIRGSGVLSSACDVLRMSVVRGVGGVCMCLALGGAG